MKKFFAIASAIATFGFGVSAYPAKAFLGSCDSSTLDNGKPARICLYLDNPHDLIEVTYIEGGGYKTERITIDCTSGRLKSFQASRSFFDKNDAMEYCLERGTTGLAGLFFPGF